MKFPTLHPVTLQCLHLQRGEEDAPNLTVTLQAADDQASPQQTDRSSTQSLRGGFRVESPYVQLSVQRCEDCVQEWQARKISLLSWQACRPIASAIVKLN